MRLFKRNEESKTINLSKDSLYLIFCCVVTAFVLQVTKLGFFVAAIFVAIEFIYCRLLRFVWRLTGKLLLDLVGRAVDRTGDK